MLGFATAKLAVERGRTAFFPDGTDLPIGRAQEVSGDDLVPQFGFVGARFCSTRILLLGINPGNAPNHIRSSEDVRMMPAITRFAESPTEENYAGAVAAYMSVCQNWPFWKRYCSEVMGAGRLSFDDIAFANCLPWRTESGSNFSENVSIRAVEFFVRPLIQELEPSIIVALGKTRVPSILSRTGLSLPKIIVWNCARALTSSVKQERAMAARETLEFARTRNLSDMK
jgi:hypothetical protein